MTGLKKHHITKISKFIVDKFAAIVIVAAVASIGIYTLANTHAASPYNSTEAESGTLTSPAVLQADTQASGGEAVMFGSTTTSTSGITYGIIDSQLLAETISQRASDLANLKTLGVTSIRIEANQGYVQYNGSGTFDWSSIDPAVTAVHTAGMGCDLIIDGSASWDAVNGISTAYGQPLNATDYANWAQAVVTRYKSECNVFELWNEPNGAQFWQPTPNASAYTQDMIAAYKAIKSVDPASIVLSGGLAPESNDGTNINGITFLQDIYADGGKGYFDAVGYHPYSYPDLPNTYASWSGWSQMDATSPSIRSVMVSNGDSAKDIWITEIGAPTGGPDAITQANQALEFTQSIANAKSYGFIGGYYIYEATDEGTDTTNDQDWFGLQSSTDVHKPSWAAVQQAIQ